MGPAKSDLWKLLITLPWGRDSLVAKMQRDLAQIYFSLESSGIPPVDPARLANVRPTIEVDTGRIINRMS